MTRGRVLIVAGSDSGGGAGLQGDVKTVTVLGGHAATAVTAVTVQNTLGVLAVWPVPAAVVVAQMRAVLDDIGADAVKLGMLGGADVIAAVADVLTEYRLPVVLDPVMVAKGGARLLADDDVYALRGLARRVATVVTPNAPELAALTGLPVTDAASALAAGRTLMVHSESAVLVKGGHLPGPEVRDFLLEGYSDPSWTARAARVDTRHTHGTGCALASAVACGLAQGLGLRDAVARAHAFVGAAIRAAPGLGQGHGPLGFLAGARAVDRARAAG